MRFWSTIGGLMLAGAAYSAMRAADFPTDQCLTAAVTSLCAVWWIFEALPLPATSLVPLVVFPMTGVLSERQAATAYGDPIVLLFMGGFMLSKAAERWEAHRRIAGVMLAGIGGSSGRRVVLAFMVATAIVSMWISNAAAALMMMPVALAVLEGDSSGKLAVPIVLGVAYSASIGGISTPIGTPPNGICLAVYQQVTGESISFPRWMALGGLIAVLMLGAAWIVLSWRLRGVTVANARSGEAWTSAQKRTLAVFALAALAWITRENPFGGWSQLLEISTAQDMTVAIAAVVALFLIPNGIHSGERLLDWRTASSIPWGVLILFGGGIAIAAAFEESGLSVTVGETVQGLRDWPLLALLATVCVAVTFLSEVTSNTATSNILMPILAAAAKANAMDPALLMLPATFANSLSFMMPVGTPPNAIAFGTGHVRIAHMVLYGLVLNLIGATIVTLVCWCLLPRMFGE
jgi:sodium-dependent dicarboxylate transporter 2/3/5